MDKPKRRGRPPKPPQSMPMFVGTPAARVMRTVPITARVSAELDRYLAWACELAALAKDEALFLMVEHAVVDFIKRDQLYQRERVGAGRDGGSGDQTIVTSGALR